MTFSFLTLAVVNNVRHKRNKWKVECDSILVYYYL